MTDSTGMAGINPIWAVAIVLLFFLFERRGGFGDMFGGGAIPFMANGANFNNDCVNNKNLLEFGFAAANGATNQLNALSQQQTANWYNTNQHIDNIYQKQQEEKIFDLKMQNIQLQNQMYSQGQFNSLQAQINEIACNLPKRPPFYSCGVIPTGCNYPCTTTTTTAS